MVDYASSRPDMEGQVPLSQARHFAELAPRNRLHAFGQESGVNIHCQPDDISLSCAVALEWLDEQFLETKGLH